VYQVIFFPWGTELQNEGYESLCYVLIRLVQPTEDDDEYNEDHTLYYILMLYGTWTQTSVLLDEVSQFMEPLMASVG